MLPTSCGGSQKCLVLFSFMCKKPLPIRWNFHCWCNTPSSSTTSLLSYLGSVFTLPGLNVFHTKSVLCADSNWQKTYLTKNCLTKNCLDVVLECARRFWMEHLYYHSSIKYFQIHLWASCRSRYAIRSALFPCPSLSCWDNDGGHGWYSCLKMS